MALKAKTNALKQIYQIYDDFIQTQDLICQKHCASCCTCDVTLTTLEGHMIISALNPAEKHDLLNRLRQKAPAGRLLPDITPNRMARLCAQGEAFADSDRQPVPTSCPLLNENTCPIYEDRPFGCRSLVSHEHCKNTGYATTNDYILSVNTLFMQVIEHLDSRGRFGNLTDILLFLETGNRAGFNPQNSLSCAGRRLIRNQPLEVLMIPPEHRTSIQPILASLKKITLS